MGQEVSFIGTFANAFKASRQGAIIGLLALGNVYFAAQWKSSQGELKSAYKDLVDQERAHSEERGKFRDEQNKQWYTIGELKAQIRYSK